MFYSFRSFGSKYSTFIEIELSGEYSATGSVISVHLRYFDVNVRGTIASVLYSVPAGIGCDEVEGSIIPGIKARSARLRK